MELKIDIAKAAAKILIEAGYAISSNIWLGRFDKPYQWVRLERGNELPVSIYENNYDGMVQANVIENWLNMFHSELWEQSKILRIPQTNNMLDLHLWRLSRIDLCLEMLNVEGV